MKMKIDTAFINANIATMNDDSGYGEIKQGAVLTYQGNIVWVGFESEMAELDGKVDIIDCQQKWLTPGLIDCHTHVVFGGNRANEFELRLQGASYEEIARAGGGIISTVRATREASEDDLFVSAKTRIDAMLANGVTTVEIKSGYGLSLESEEKMLKVARRIGQQESIDVVTTFLGAHALPPEFKDDSDGYIDHICREMMPVLAGQNLVDAVDVFCEGIGFSHAQTKRVFESAKALSLPVKIHAEQLSDLGGSTLAANFNALSSDHLEYLSEQSIEAMKQAGTVAVLLPGAFYFLRETKLPPINLLRKHGVRVAVATDCNPGSSPIASLQLMLNMACTLFRLTPAEALSGVTKNAAKALGLRDRGQIAVGKKADLALWNISQPAELCYQFGVNPLLALYKNGKLVSHK